MPDIDPAALSHSDSVTTANPASLSLSKTNGISTQPSLKTIKTVNTAQRIDLEPLYTSLKAAIGDNWGTYKDALSLFVSGMNLYPHEAP
jgi:transcriptional coactivator HFI1/ADA1